VAWHVTTQAPASGDIPEHCPTRRNLWVRLVSSNELVHERIRLYPKLQPLLGGNTGLGRQAARLRQ
jgi:hypothetical protein